MLILGIESSCDETGVALYDTDKGLIADALHTQIEMHRLYGGVVPELASRDHIRRIIPLLNEVMKKAGKTPQDLDAVAVTEGPGLAGALLVGNSVAYGIGLALNISVVGIHHLEGHLLSSLLAEDKPSFPFVALLVSGGHTQIMEVRALGDYELLGETLDDAAGEAFDKVARSVGLGYPGGPKIDKAAKEGNPHAIQFPRGKVEGAPYDFSFSGLKSAVLNHINHARMTGEEINVPDLVASFQNSVVESLVSRAILAAHEFGYKKLAIAGGVASNSALRKAMAEACEKDGIQFYYPSPIFCTDNAAMIGTAAYYEYLKGNISGWDLNAIPNLKLGER